MFRPVLRLSSGMKIQKSYKGRYKKDFSAPLVQANLDPGKYLEKKFHHTLESIGY